MTCEDLNVIPKKEIKIGLKHLTAAEFKVHSFC